MLSSVPISGNPWPHDVVITVEDDVQALVDLLWVRKTWNLKPAGDDLPSFLSATSVGADSGAASADKIARWQDAWPAVWEACIHHAGQIRVGRLSDQLSGTANGSIERAELLHLLIGPSWRDMFGDATFTDQHQIWNQAQFDESFRGRPRLLEEEPERVSLVALIRAWQAGLSKIVVVPCRGSDTRVIG